MDQECKNDAQVNKYRNALGQFPTGVAIVTALADNLQPVGVTINSFNSISMSPALVSWNIDHGAASYHSFTKANSYTVTVLAEYQADLAIRFATRGENKFRNIDIEGNEAPIIPGGCAWFKCDIYRSILLGDHTMLVGRVIEFATNSASPLIFKGGQFLQPAMHATVPTQAAA
jgi:3-hydroxy-9,10-secoandrosta-1,3,5(10)-triene-9,17-dione monooxygenase reductase component